MPGPVLTWSRAPNGEPPITIVWHWSVELAPPPATLMPYTQSWWVPDAAATTWLNPWFAAAPGNADATSGRAPPAVTAVAVPST